MLVGIGHMYAGHGGSENKGYERPMVIVRTLINKGVTQGFACFIFFMPNY